MTFDCQKCGKKFKETYHLLRHSRRKVPCDRICTTCNKTFSSNHRYLKHSCDSQEPIQLTLASIELEKVKIEHETKRIETEQETKRVELVQETKRKELEFKTEKLKLKKEQALQLASPRPHSRHEQLLIPLTDFDLKYLTAVENPLNSHTKIVYEINIKTDGDGNREIETNEIIERRRKYVERAEMAITPTLMAETLKCCLYNLHQEFHIMRLLTQIHAEKDTPRLHSIKYMDEDQNMKTFERPSLYQDQTIWTDHSMDEVPRKLESHARKLVSFILQSVTNKLEPGFISGGVTREGIVLRKTPCLYFPLDDENSCILFENKHRDTELIVDTVPTEIIHACPDELRDEITWMYDSLHSRRKRLAGMMNEMKFESQDIRNFLLQVV